MISSGCNFVGHNYLWPKLSSLWKILLVNNLHSLAMRSTMARSKLEALSCRKSFLSSRIIWLASNLIVVIGRYNREDCRNSFLSSRIIWWTFRKLSSGPDLGYTTPDSPFKATAVGKELAAAAFWWLVINNNNAMTGTGTILTMIRMQMDHMMVREGFIKNTGP